MDLRWEILSGLAHMSFDQLLKDLIYRPNLSH